MKKQILSNLKQPITSVLGLVIVGVTLWGIYQGVTTWKWDGVIGVVLGVLFFLVPDKIVNLIISSVKKLISKDNGSNPNADLQ